MKLEAIEDFIARVKKMARTNSKDMRLSFAEANALAVNLAELMTQVAKQSVAQESSPPTKIDGGFF